MEHLECNRRPDHIFGTTRSWCVCVNISRRRPADAPTNEREGWEKDRVPTVREQDLVRTIRDTGERERGAHRDTEGGGAENCVLRKVLFRVYIWGRSDEEQEALAARVASA